ncbi:uncharacterized protein LOC111866527 isoform X2 [Cryptotermes secundus]|uniref:uncharacterized protein LOC111866527 isoform X2 n=1 Tax=Cryptotermes secundus TaxID=105785 RepID=UPI001454CFB2|nr:uncharacterized protein LOC111866527 isoform X2 [Cryptotermes secundus]
MNSQNNRIWSSENPHMLHGKPLHYQKIGVLCAVPRQIVGPIFFETTVNSPVYQDIITQFIVLLEVDERECWLQQDGATCHTSNEAMQFLCEFFRDRPISKGLCPPRSSNLSPADFFPLGYLKGIVYKNNQHTLDDLKKNTMTAINSISLQVLHKVASNMTQPEKLSYKSSSTGTTPSSERKHELGYSTELQVDSADEGLSSVETSPRPPPSNGSNNDTLDHNNRNSTLNLNMTAKELRAQLASRKKYDPKKESMDFKKKFDIVQKL